MTGVAAKRLEMRVPRRATCTREYLIDLERTIAHRVSRKGDDYAAKLDLLDIQGRLQRELWPCPDCVLERRQHPKECARCGIGGVDPDSMGDELAELKAAGAWWEVEW